jgi:hypothetical protein
MAQQYRHIIPANPASLPCNHNLFDIHSLMTDPLSARALMPILNSSLVALIKTFFGRYAGTEGNLKTEIVDVVMIEIPDPRNTTESILRKLEVAFASMQKRPVTHLVEQEFLDCHTRDEVREAAKLPYRLPRELQQSDRRQLDDAVFELLGVTDAKKRAALVDQLYLELAIHFRGVRIIEVQKMEQRRQGGGTRDVSALDLAADAWTELEDDLKKPLSVWLGLQRVRSKTVFIPDGTVRLPDEGHFFEASTVFFGSKPAVSVNCDSREQAELLSAVANAGIRGDALIPPQPDDCREVQADLRRRLLKTREKVTTLAESRAGSDKIKEQIVEIMLRWAAAGKQSEVVPSAHSSPSGKGLAVT